MKVTFYPFRLNLIQQQPSILCYKTAICKQTRRRFLSSPATSSHEEHGNALPTHLDSETHPSTISAIKQDNQYLLQMYARPNIIFTHGKGCKLYDLSGREYLDLNSGIAVNALGHADEELHTVIADQATKLIHLSNLYHNEHAGTLAKILVEALGNRGKWAASPEYGGSTKVFLCNSGTEANEGAIKFAKKWGKQQVKEGKHEIISFSNAFHGRSLGALSATPNPKYQSPFMPLMPGFNSIPFNDVEKAISTIDEKTCGVIVEPIQGEGGVFPASQEFLTALRERCDAVGALLIFDEIQCGLGRTGKFFAHENYTGGVTPDVLTIAKPLANGIPAGAIIVSPKVAAILKPGDHGTTFGGSPFASRVAVNVVKRINDPAFLQHVTQTGRYFSSKLQEIADTTPLIKEVRGTGLILGVQLRDGVDANMFVNEARERGVLMITAGSNTIRILPPLIITNKEVDEAIQVIEEVVSVLETEYASGRV